MAGMSIKRVKESAEVKHRTEDPGEIHFVLTTSISQGRLSDED